MMDTITARIAARARDTACTVFCHLLDDGTATAITYGELSARALDFAATYRARTEIPLV